MDSGGLVRFAAKGFPCRLAIFSQGEGIEPGRVDQAPGQARGLQGSAPIVLTFDTAVEKDKLLGFPGKSCHCPKQSDGDGEIVVLKVECAFLELVGATDESGHSDRMASNVDDAVVGETLQRRFSLSLYIYIHYVCIYIYTYIHIYIYIYRCVCIVYNTVYDIYIYIILYYISCIIALRIM